MMQTIDESEVREYLDSDGPITPQTLAELQGEFGPDVDAVRVLGDETDSPLVLVGTVHAGMASMPLVESVIQEYKPTRVGVEEGRYAFHIRDKLHVHPRGWDTWVSKHAARELEASVHGIDRSLSATSLWKLRNGRDVPLQIFLSYVVPILTAGLAGLVVLNLWRGQYVSAIICAALLMVNYATVVLQAKRPAIPVKPSQYFDMGFLAVASSGFYENLDESPFDPDLSEYREQYMAERIREIHGDGPTVVVVGYGHLRTLAPRLGPDDEWTHRLASEFIDVPTPDDIA